MDGFSIIDSFSDADFGVVLRERDCENGRFSTHEYRVALPSEMYGGHYFNDRKAAVKDFARRVKKLLPVFNAGEMEDYL